MPTVAEQITTALAADSGLGGPQWQAAFRRAVPDYPAQTRLLAETGRHVWMGDVR